MSSTNSRSASPRVLSLDALPPYGTPQNVFAFDALNMLYPVPLADIGNLTEYDYDTRADNCLPTTISSLRDFCSDCFVWEGVKVTGISE